MSNFLITGNDDTGYHLVHKSSGEVTVVCPCCVRPIKTRRNAEVLAEAMTIAEENHNVQ